MTALWGLLGELLKGLIGPIAEAWRQWRAERTARELGQSQERNRQHEAWEEQQRRVGQAAREADGRSDDDVRRRLRESATDRPAAPSKGGPV